MNHGIPTYAQVYDCNGNPIPVCTPNWPSLEPMTILFKAIEQINETRDCRVMFALVDKDDYRNGKPAKNCIKTYCDIESKKLREVIYKEIEKEVSNE